jgi:hypothetical protein
VERITPEQLLERLRHLAKGQILCEPNDSISLNLAASLAGLHDAILSDRDIGLPTLFDMRARFNSPLEAYGFAEKEILPRASRQGVVLLGAALPFRDYGIKQKLISLPIPPLSDKEAWRLLSRLISAFPAGSPIFSPPPERLHSSIPLWAAQIGHPLLGCEEAANLSYTSTLQTPPFRQWRRFTQLEGRIYVCFLLSGGNDLSYLQQQMSSLWEESRKSAFPLGWVVPAQTAELAPALLQTYFASAYRSGSDSFLFQADSPSLAKANAFTSLKTARGKTDIRAVAVKDDSPDAVLMPAVEGFAADFQPGVIFLPDRASLPSRMIGGTALITKGFSSSSAQEILDRLSALPVSGAGLIFILADSKNVSLSAISSIANFLPPYFSVVGPEEFSFLAKQILTGEKQEIPSQTIVTLTAPKTAAPDERFTVFAAADSRAAGDAVLVYQQEGGIRLMEPMEKKSPGSYALTLGPLLHGGEWLLQARVSEGEGKAAWSETVRLQAPLQDDDDDGLSAPEERLFATDSANPDTDDDGLPDGLDSDPLKANLSPAVYFGPIRPAEDAPFLAASQGSILEEGARRIVGDGFVIYRLFIEDLPPEAQAALAMRLKGEARAAFSADGRAFGEPQNLQGPGRWKTAPIPEGLVKKGGFFVRISAAEDSPEGVRIEEAAVTSPLDAPSIAPPLLMPPYPGPGVLTRVSVDLWSPKGISAAWYAYRAGRGFVSLPLEKIGKGPAWTGALGLLENARQLDWWIIAEDGAGRRSASRILHTWVGTIPGETICLFPEQEMTGFWKPAEAGWGAARAAALPELRDWAEVETAGGTYEIWILAGGRGREIGVWIDGSFFAGIEAKRPDGWQHLGKIRLTPGLHRMEIVSGAGGEGAAAIYGQILLTPTSSFRPPPRGRLELANSLMLFSPKQGEKIGPRTEVFGTAAGNITRVDFFVDDKLLRRFTTPPFSFTWDSGRLSEGKHILRMVGMGGTRRPLMALEVEVEFVKESPEESRP